MLILLDIKNWYQNNSFLKISCLVTLSLINLTHYILLLI